MIFISDRFYLFLKSLLLGLLIIGFLVLNGNVERLLIIAATLLIINILMNIRSRFNYAPIIIMGLIIGYILGNFLLYYSFISNDNNQDINRKNYNEKISKPAVIIFSIGEPTTYKLSVVLNNIYSDKSIIRKAIAPIEASRYKAAYENIGGSRNMDFSNRIKDELDIRLGTDYDLYVAYFNTTPSIYDELERLGKRYERIILAPLMISESMEYTDLKKAVEGNFLNNDTQIKFTPLLWKSHKLSKQVLEKAVEKAELDKIDSTGVLLLMSNRYSFYEQSIFCNDVTNKMERSKFDRDNIVCLKYDNKEKLFIKAIRKLKERGVDKILVISIARLQDEILDQNRISKLVKRASKREFVRIEYINGWGIDENLLNELEYNIRITNIKK
ncbi:ferrochelatase [Wukongibacter sp. M2B1]|uniref:ferrochelatase n=1 Tax=Wukongibacter sp. M2B1 TaxID=3088895 RepID=UPI003D79131A